MNRYFEDAAYYLRRTVQSIRRGIRYEVDTLRGRARDDISERRERATVESQAYVARARSRFNRGREDEAERKPVA
ncbi:hypothetical protein [Haloglomus litoreum]|uniref:hypothetical protein n=1 Tax=Haloglomus litoreum TaxID=3034026 RepID=UPI0023E794C2|nr:hypothetical protein [Haloglomus sp. DT116]